MGPLEFPAWDPVLLDLPGPLDIRWYGMMYVVAFVIAQVMLTRLARAGFLPIEPGRVTDLIFYSVIGTVLGGRLGYVLFYDQGLADPLKLIKVWEGGLSFHGGLLGVILAMALFARRQRVPIGRVLDAAALAVTPGIFAVRIANFINGELFGRVTTKDTPLAMQFPTDPRAMELLGLRAVTDKRDEELAIQYAYRHVEWEDIEGRLNDTNAFGREIPWDRIRDQLDWAAVRAVPAPPDGDGVPFRHPSQLYEAVGEGVLLGVLLWAVYFLTRRRSPGPWTFGGLFLIGYGTVRFFVEFLRQPDAQFRDGPDDPIGTVLFGMTMGQTLCATMILGGAWLLWWAARRAGPAGPGGSDGPERPGPRDGSEAGGVEKPGSSRA